MQLRVATRGSALARWQANHVAELLGRTQPDVDVELIVVSTEGDRDKSTPLGELGGRGIFAKEIQEAVLDGRADLAVHSGKDLPSITPPGLTIAAVPERADPRDALVGSTVADLPEGATIATGSIRRKAQLANHRPDLRFVELRGNIGTRLAKAADYDGAIVAAAALDRLELAPPVVERLAPELMLPQVAQGALAIECLADRDDIRSVVATIEDGQTRRAVDAERAFLAELFGDCDLPVAGYATVDPDNQAVTLRAMILSESGEQIVQGERRGDDPHTLGRELARHLIDDAGGAALLPSSGDG